MGKEFELKFSATEDVLPAIRAAFPGTYETIAMETTYYDTPGSALSARRWTLRRRLENGISVCTLKTPIAGRGRGEWEWVCDAIEDAVPELCKLSGLPELLSLTEGGLVPICGARFIRQAVTLTLEDGTAELALDAGILFGGGRELPFAEVEVEQKTCAEDALIRFAKVLAARFCLREEPKSKFQRALALTKGE